MKIARGSRLAVVSGLSLAGLVATTAYAVTRPDPLPGQDRPAAGISGPVEQAADERDSASVAPTATPTATPATTSRATTQTGAVGAQATATPAAAVRAQPRFDLDGDGKDEVVVAGVASSIGLVLHVRYSGIARRDILSVHTIAEPRHVLTQRFTAGDFDGDGFQDLAVASQRMLSQGVFEHGIFVYPGGSAGLEPTQPTYLSGLHAGALAAGDLDRDGRDELAIADGGATAERDGPFRGSVTVLSGTTDGLTKEGSVTVRQVVPRWSGLLEEQFGTGLAIGDFTGDGYADLVVNGSRRGTGESDWHGMLTLVPGSAGGPDTTRVTKIEGQLDTPGTSLPVDVMVMSDMNRDGRQDLVLGLPRHAGGEIVYLRGAAAGLTWAGYRLIDQDTRGIPGQPDPDANGGHFGYSLATGDATGDGIPDLLVGAMTMTVGVATDAGSVTLIPGTATGPTGAGSLVYSQPLPSGRRPDPAIDYAESNDYLGSSVAILDLDGTGPLEMFVESRREDFRPEAGGEPHGLVTTLRLQYGAPRPGSSQPVPRFAPSGLRPADFSAAGFQIVRLGYGLLGG